VNPVQAQLADAYMKTRIMTASPEQLQLMLYDGAIRFATEAKTHMAEGRTEQCHHQLLRAQKIVMELIHGLRPDVNADLCNKMSSLYNFVYRKLVDANVRKEADCIDDATQVLAIIRDGWGELIAGLNTTKTVLDEAQGPAPATGTFSIVG